MCIRDRAEYDRLGGPAFSDVVYEDANDRLRWRDDSTTPPTVHTGEPDASVWRRMIASVLRVLPIESQL